MIYGEPISPALWHVLDLLLPLPATVLAYEAGLRLQRRCKGNALANPVLIAVVLASVLLSGISMQRQITPRGFNLWRSCSDRQRWHSQ